MLGDELFEISFQADAVKGDGKQGVPDVFVGHAADFFGGGLVEARAENDRYHDKAQHEFREALPQDGCGGLFFPKFVLGFVVVSVIFSTCFDMSTAKEISGVANKNFREALFSIAFVSIGLETNFKQLFSQQNKKPMYAFLAAQLFNVVLTLAVAYVLFGLIAPNV